VDLAPPGPSATDGEIAAINLESARRGAWARFAHDARLRGVAEAVVDHERLTAQFLGDLGALDRLETLACEFARVEDSSRAALVQAEVASAAHRFADARDHLAQAALLGGPAEAIDRQTLTIDQACGVEVEAVLAARQRIATASNSLEDLVPLGAVLADLERFAEADAVYRQALYSYGDVSPFPLAWVCFQLGMLWGELVPAPEMNRAAFWYRRALSYVPGYAKARVHLAEIYTSQGLVGEAEELLLPAVSSHDPEVLAFSRSADGAKEFSSRRNPPRGRTVWLRSASQQTSTRLRGSCRGVLCRQRKRPAARARARSRQCREPADPSCGEAAACDRAVRVMGRTVIRLSVSSCW
jgi:tetratricopeptide (TPR) repeat protein